MFLLLFFVALIEIVKDLKLVKIINDARIVNYSIPKSIYMYNADNFEFILGILMSGCGAGLTPSPLG